MIGMVKFDAVHVRRVRSEVFVRQNPRHSGIGKHGIQSKVPFSDPGVRDVMVSHSKCQSHARRGKVLNTWSSLKGKVHLATVFSNTGSEIGPQHSDSNIPEGYPASE